MERLKQAVEFVTITLVILAAIYLAPILTTKEIDVTRQAIIYKIGDEASAVETAIKIRGELHKPWNKVGEFRGRIMIEELPNTIAYELSPLMIYHKEKGMNSSVLFYFSNSKDFLQNQLYASGNIQFDNKFSKIIMWVTQDGERYEVVAEARTVEEALALRQQYELKD